MPGATAGRFSKSLRHIRIGLKASALISKLVPAVLGYDREVVRQTAAEIRGVRPPEPYHGKGIRYAGEKIRRKAGKAGKGAK